MILQGLSYPQYPLLIISVLQVGQETFPIFTHVMSCHISFSPSLTWRDVQHLVVRTARPTREAATEAGWQTNGLGRQFHLMQVLCPFFSLLY